jgi:hypothetical protein
MLGGIVSRWIGRGGEECWWGVHTNRDALDFSVGIGYGEVVEEEHAVEGLGEELDLCLVH